jgi:hypothetical protein
MFAALVRYDECQRGMVEHAMRIVVRRTRVGPIYPATHKASVGNLTDPNIPAMGQRVRLKSSFVIPDSWTIYEKSVLRGLKKYGAIVADNGNFFSISVTPDDRYPANAFSHLSSITITNFEVVQTTGANEGPRSPNPPQANAGEDSTGVPNTPLQLNGSASNASTVEWKMYSGPGQVTFSDAARTNTTANFSATGTYTLVLKAGDDIHTPAFDAVQVSVGQTIAPLSIQISRSANTVTLNWAIGTPPTIEESSNPAGPWTALTTTDQSNYQITVGNGPRFYRLQRN